MSSLQNPLASTLILAVGSGALWYSSTTGSTKQNKKSQDNRSTTSPDESGELDFSVLPCIRNRRSIFPKSFLKNPPPLDDAIIQSLLDAALWSPFHGKCYAGQQHPAKFVVLGSKAMVEMQNMTLEYYDHNWENHTWNSKNSEQTNEEAYKKWRQTTLDEITGRWAPCSHMIAIVMRRQSGPKRLPEWEEAAATATAVQNMHIQSTKYPQLACYWSSWHDAARDSDEMKSFLKIGAEDKCMGFFIVAQRDPRRCSTKDRRSRNRSLMEVEWRS